MNAGSSLAADSAQMVADNASRNLFMIMSQLRTQNEQLEAAIIRSGRTTAFLIVILIILLLIILRLISKRKLFASFPNYRQKKGFQPGILCLQMMNKYFYGKRSSYRKFLKLSNTESSAKSYNLEDIANTARQSGFDIKILKADLGEIYRNIKLPAMIYLPNHMAVLYAIKNDCFYLSDPYHGHIRLRTYYFASSWFVDHRNLRGIIIQLYPLKTPRKSLSGKLDLEKFKKLKPMERKSWKEYTCELEV